MWFTSGELAIEADRHGVVVVGAVRLDVGVVVVDAEIDRPRQGLILPLRVAVPPLRGKWVKHHPVHSHAKGLHGELGGLTGNLGLSRHLEGVVLRGDRIRIPAPGKLPDIVVRNAVGADDALPAIDGDRNFV